MMATAMAWRSSIFRFPDPWPMHHPQYCCYYLRLLLWFSMLAFFVIIMEVPGVAEARVSSKGCLQRERDALLLYKAAIEDPSARLSSWRAQVDCCAWTGVVCYNTTGSVRVAELNLGNPNYSYEEETTLKGELLHPSLSSLTHLQSLNLSFNDFNGTRIPPLIGSLHKLRYLDLSDSNIGGTIPPHLGNLTHLLYLDLSDCNIGGTIPPHLGNLTHLRYLDLSYNYAKVVHSLDWLTGLSSNLIYLGMSGLDLSAGSHNWISAVNMLPSLQQLCLYDCSINIPLSLTFHLNLTSLRTLDLGGNIFNYSSFPNWLWNLTSLSSLQLSWSEIHGTLPNEIGNLNSLTHLDLFWNSLSGPLPDTLWKLKHLTYLDLSFNFLGNSLPMGIMNLSSLSTLYLENCSLIGPIPSELGNLTTLNALSLQSNLLSGFIPHEIGNLVNLESLDLSVNSFEGDLTEFHLSNLTKLKALLLSDNPSITIAIDDAWTPPFQLETINLGSLKLGPRFPAWFRSQRSFTRIQLYDTSIEDTFPEWLWNSSSTIVLLDLSNNVLIDEIPEELGHLVELYVLNLSRNYFKGKIPDSISRLSSLEVLDLSFNYLSGVIPPDLSQLNALSYLNLSYNNLSGIIPSGNQLQTFDASIYIGNHYLCGDLVYKSCFHGNNINETSEEHVMLTIYLSSTLGYLVGLWSVYILLLFKKKWRYSYFKKVDDIYDKVYVTIKIRLNRIVNG